MNAKATPSFDPRLISDQRVREARTAARKEQPEFVATLKPVVALMNPATLLPNLRLSLGRARMETGRSVLLKDAARYRLSSMTFLTTILKP